MLQPNRESLEVTINKLKKNEILLPDFQRQFVWKEEEMQHKLVASVLTKMPIGSILLLKSKDAHDYSCKPLGAKDPIPSEQLPSGAVEFLLDGQQRMTVLANVFSDAIFQLTPQSNNLIAPSALKRRFYLAVPKYGNDAFPDLFGLHSLSFPMRTPDSDEPEFLTQDILPFIRVVPFNVKRDNGKCYNPYSRPIPRMLSELETYCPSVEDGWSYIPLYLLVENETISLNHTTLNNIIVSIAKSVSTAKQLTLNEMLNAGQINEFPKVYLETFLNILSLICYNGCRGCYTVEHLKRQRKLSLTAKQIDSTCERCCQAIDRACFFFQARCGIRTLKEVNYTLMVPIVGYILDRDACYTGENSSAVFDLLEAWYWSSIFSGAYDKDQNQVMINQPAARLQPQSGSFLSCS